MTTVITREQGYTGFSPEIVRIVTTSTLSQVTTAGWYNNSPIAGESLANVDVVLICYAYASSSQATSFFNVSISAKGVVTLSIGESDIVLPTIANHIATYTNTSGTLSEDPATAISGGNIQAGLSGTAGEFISYPSTASKGSLIFKAVANTGNTNTTISNVAMGQASVISVPDPGAATANIAVAPSALVSGNLVKASGTAGLIVDQGNSMKVGKQVAVAGGNAAQTVTDAACISTSSVIASWNDTTNACEIKTVAAGSGTFVVTSTADPGASHLNYVIFN